MAFETRGTTEMVRFARICIALFAAASAHQYALPHTSAGPQEFNAMRVAYEANRDSFPFGSLSLVDRPAQSKDARDDLSEVAGRQQIRYIWNGKSRIFENLKMNPISDGDKTANQSTLRILTDGSSTFVVSVSRDKGRLAESYQIAAGDDTLPSVLTCPLQIGYQGRNNFQLGDDILKGLQPNSTDWRLEYVMKNETLGAVQVEHIKMVSSQKVERHYWVDLTKGCVPVKITDFDADKTEFMSIHYDDVRSIPGKGWLPYQMTIEYAQPSKSYRIIEVVESDFSTPPPASVFRLKFDKPVTIIDGEKKVKYSGIKEFDFKKLSGMSTVKLSMAPFPDDQTRPPVLPGERKSALSAAWLTILIGAALLAIGGLIYWRRRR